MRMTTFNDVSIALTIIAKNTALIKQKEAKANEKINLINQKLEVDISEPVKENELLMADIQRFCEMDKAAFDKQRTMTFASGEVGFRNNPPKVVQLNRKYTMATTIELLKKIFKGTFLRTKEEVDKEGLLSAYSKGEVTDQKLAAVGLKVDQGETFFIKPNWEEYYKENYKQAVK